MICDFCYRHCDIKEGAFGWCQSRTVDAGILKDTAYGYLTALADDPVEKKPLYHFLPGTRTLSLSMQGCCFDCDFCQNYEIAKRKAKGRFYPPSEIICIAADNHFPSVSFTYTEPLVWQDYMLEVAKGLKDKGIRSIMVSNGAFSQEALERLLPVIDAFNIDLKGNADFYKEICHSSITPVLDGIEAIVKANRHLEVTTMLIEGIHDTQCVKELGKLLKERGVKVWHLSRFYPMYRMSDRQPTSEAFLEKLLKVAAVSGMEFIYPGNSRLPSPTICPECGHTIRVRPGVKIKDACPECGRRLYGLF